MAPRLQLAVLMTTGFLSKTLCLGLALLLTSVAGIARADDVVGQAPSDDHDAESLGMELAVYGASAKHERIVAGATGAMTGALLLPTGIALSTRSDDVSQSIGVGMIVGGSASLLVSLASLRSSTMEGLATSFEEARASGAASAELVRATELAWADAAEKSHRKRIGGGIVALALGAACTGAGLYLMLSEPGVFGQSRNGQYTTGSFLIGPGVPILGNGIRALVQETPEETSWKAHRASKGGARSSGPVPEVSLAPVRGGGFATVSLAF